MKYSYILTVEVDENETVHTRVDQEGRPNTNIARLTIGYLEDAKFTILQWLDDEAKEEHEANRDKRSTN